jgi:hypothetical protein
MGFLDFMTNTFATQIGILPKIGLPFSLHMVSWIAQEILLWKATA